MKHRIFLLSTKKLTLALLSALVVLLCWFAVPTRSADNATYSEVFQQAWQTINENFFDPNFNGVDWEAARDRYAPQIRAAKSQEEVTATINRMLSELKTSHTQFYTPQEPAYYQLLGIFAPRNSELAEQAKSFLPDGKLEYTDIGIVTRQIEGKTFIKAVFDGSPAAAAGLLTGDRILSVDNNPFHPIHSFAGKAGQSVQIAIERSPGDVRKISVTPQVFNAETMFLDAMRASIQIRDRDNSRIGYIHIWSYASEEAQKILEQELLYGSLRAVDALVLDLREGWGGASLDYLNLFLAKGPTLTAINRNGQRYTYPGSWNKPVVMLVNEGSRSAKEIFAYVFQRYNIGPVVGAKTPGAVVAGRAFLMSDGSLLYVAVNDVYIDGGTRLEGVGVTPDVVVPFNLPYANGADPQKERAIAVAVDKINNQKP